jgi:DNA/RNA-binding domain of Phe-tRNA-synthetase-like protein
MKFIIDPSVIEMFPSVKIGILVGKGLDNHSMSSAITSLLHQTEDEVRKRHSVEDLSTMPKISDWREAYRKFGFKPSSHRSSVEALLRRVVQGKPLPSINSIVDLYNLISIKHVFPVGGDDLEHVEGKITLTVANGSEHFVMLGTEVPEKIKEGEIIYRDEREVLCRSWNYRECEKTKITKDTKNICLVIEGLDHAINEEIKHALSELRNLLAAHCKGVFQEFFLNRDFSEVLFQ